MRVEGVSACGPGELALSQLSASSHTRELALTIFTLCVNDIHNDVVMIIIAVVS